MTIIDFDDTLFDTHSFKQLRMDSLSALGVSVNLYKETYHAARKHTDGEYYYSPAYHAELLAKHGFGMKKLLVAFDSTTSPESLHACLLPFAEQLLQYLKSLGEPLILLSTGDPDFQTLKINGSGLGKYADHVILVHGSKQEALRTLFQIYDEGSTWFINDKVGETLTLQAVFPRMHIVLKKSPNIDVQEYQASTLPYFEKLDEIKQYVQRSQ